jgi:hypothetical protein
MRDRGSIANEKNSTLHVRLQTSPPTPPTLKTMSLHALELFISKYYYLSNTISHKETSPDSNPLPSAGSAIPIDALPEIPEPSPSLHTPLRLVQGNRQHHPNRHHSSSVLFHSIGMAGRDVNSRQSTASRGVGEYRCFRQTLY